MRALSKISFYFWKFYLIIFLSLGIPCVLASADPHLPNTPHSDSGEPLKLPTGQYFASSGDLTYEFSIERVPGFSVYKMTTATDRRNLFTFFYNLVFSLEWNPNDRVFRVEKRMKALTGCFWDLKIEVSINAANQVYFREWRPDNIHFDLDHIEQDCAYDSYSWHYFDKEAEYHGRDIRTFAENLLLSPDPTLVEQAQAQMAAIKGNVEAIDTYYLRNGSLPPLIPELYGSILFAAAFEGKCLFLTKIIEKYSSMLTPLLGEVDKNNGFIYIASLGDRCTSADKQLLADTFLASGDFVKTNFFDFIFLASKGTGGVDSFMEVYREILDKYKLTGKKEDVEHFNVSVLNNLLRSRISNFSNADEKDENVLEFMAAFLESFPAMDIGASDHVLSSWLVVEKLPEMQNMLYRVLDHNLAFRPTDQGPILVNSLLIAIYLGYGDVIDELARLRTTIPDLERTSRTESSISFYIRNTEKLNAPFIEYLLAKGAQMNGDDFIWSPLDYLVHRYSNGQFESEKSYIATTGRWMMKVGFRLKHYKKIPW